MRSFDIIKETLGPSVQALSAGAMDAHFLHRSVPASLPFMVEREGDACRVTLRDDSLDEADYTLLRGAVDGICLASIYHSPATGEDILQGLPAALTPFIDAGERVRVAVLAAYHGRVGACDNALRYMMRAHSETPDSAHLVALALIYGFAPSQRGDIDKLPFADKLRNMYLVIKMDMEEGRRALAHQREYAAWLVRLLYKLGLGAAQEESPREEDGRETPSPDPLPQEDKQQQDDAQSDSATSREMGESAPAAPVATEDAPKEGAPKPARTPAPAYHNRQSPREGDAPPYKIYTRKYDEVVDPADICPPEELAHYYAKLQEEMRAYEHITTRLSAKLQHLVQAVRMQRHVTAQEEGVLDPSALPRLITDPLYHAPYRKQFEAPYKDTACTLLIDNSGSMRGRPIMLAAICADMLAATLERIGVAVEVIGFTTAHWKGGQSRKDWVASGAHPACGRVSDLRHIIYKNASRPWRSQRAGLGLMLREGVLKENIDGEALIFAAKRISALPQSRKIIMVISDGAPIDDSTFSANPDNQEILTRHLQEVIYNIERKTAIELLAIGIGYDVTHFYGGSVTIPDASTLPQVMVEQMSALFA